jgi:hypothetical protein
VKSVWKEWHINRSIFPLSPLTSILSDFFFQYWGLNSRPHVCWADALSLEPWPQPYIIWFLKGKIWLEASHITRSVPKDPVETAAVVINLRLAQGPLLISKMLMSDLDWASSVLHHSWGFSFILFVLWPFDWRNCYQNSYCNESYWLVFAS